LLLLFTIDATIILLLLLATVSLLLALVGAGDSVVRYCLLFTTSAAVIVRFG
jgi:hypothetical protein